MMRSVPIVVIALGCVVIGPDRTGAQAAELLGHWPLANDARDRSGRGMHAVNHGVTWKPGAEPAAASFNGRDAYLEVPKIVLGRDDFSIVLFVHTQQALDDVPGDLISQYDPKARRGFHLTVKTNAGVTFNQANERQLQFGIDDNRPMTWVDCGRPGNALVAFALAVHDGELYAGTCEPGKTESGRVYRYAGGTKWIDCGAPASCNAVTAFAVHNGKLYAGTGKYRVAGSALPESENLSLGGRIYRYDGGTTWTDCGQLAGAEAVSGLVVYRGKLYAGSLYRPAGFFRYEGGTTWVDCGVPDGKRVEALGVWNGHIYATSYDVGRVYRFDGAKWTDCGQLGDPKENTQTYSFAVHEGRLYVGTWRSGRVYRFEDVHRWTDVGRLGEELEVMGMLVHNGRLLAGSLPLAEVYSYEGDAGWRKLVQLDKTPDVRYRRAWTMAEHQGKVFCSTLPSGKIFAAQAGKNVFADRPLAAGWRHIAAVREKGTLTLHVDGKQVAQCAPFDPKDFDLTSDRPLRIGFGANDYFHGQMRDVWLYRGALTREEIARIIQSGTTE